MPPRIRPGLSFPELFGFSPRGIQQSLVESITGPGVYILEAPMGQGKTEEAKAGGSAPDMPTSVRSLFARETVEPSLRRKSK